MMISRTTNHVDYRRGKSRNTNGAQVNTGRSKNAYNLNSSDPPKACVTRRESLLGTAREALQLCLVIRPAEEKYTVAYFIHWNIGALAPILETTLTLHDVACPVH